MPHLLTTVEKFRHNKRLPADIQLKEKQFVGSIDENGFRG
jgi:hypothetical protein